MKGFEHRAACAVAKHPSTWVQRLGNLRIAAPMDLDSYKVSNRRQVSELEGMLKVKEIGCKGDLSEPGKTENVL